MAIEPLDQRTPLIDQPSHLEQTGLPQAASRFAPHLEAKLNGAPAPAERRQKALAVAEMLRLDMMRSAFTLGDGADTPPLSPSRTIEQVLRSFAENDRNPDAVSVATPLPADQSPPEESTVTEPPSLNLSSPRWLDDLATKASRRYGVEVGLIKAVIKAESNGNPRAVSHAGAQGLMQLMPATARGLGVTNSFDPEQNVMAGTRFLRELLDRYHGNVDKALAAYNWGPGNVDRKPHLLPRETRDYLAKVKSYHSQLA